jgi:hypothetical protein
MSEINYFKKIIMCSDDMTADVYQLYVKKIHLVGFSYIVIEDVQTTKWLVLKIIRKWLNI